MAKNSISKISNAFSTGGGGVNFEQQIQAMFLLSLLIDGFCPAMNEQTKKVHFQAKHLGYDIDGRSWCEFLWGIAAMVG